MTAARKRRDALADQLFHRDLGKRKKAEMKSGGVAKTSASDGAITDGLGDVDFSVFPALSRAY